MAKEAIIRKETADYNVAVQTIKEAILRSQYQRRNWSIVKCCLYTMV